jgi:glucose/arabinose dehydrogenase
MRRTRRATAVAVLLVLVTAACGGDDEPATTTTAPTSSSSTSTTATGPTTTTTAPPDLEKVALRTTQVGTFTQPLDLKWCAGRADPFVVQKTGQIRNFRTGQTILDLSGEIATAGEQGLLGMVCTASGDALFVNYTTDGDRKDVVDRFVMPADGATVDRATRRNVLTVDDPAANHNGGGMQAGPDGQLWYGLGDGGGGNDTYGNGQNPATKLAKVLRIDPATNAVTTAVSGLRNPWRFSFDRATGDLWIGDVGQNSREEIDFLPAGRIIGANAGWPLYEGNLRLKSGADPPNLVFPIFDYGRGDGASVTGGYVYRGTAIPALHGAYLFADAYTAELRAIVASGGKVVQQRKLGVRVPGILASFAEHPGGELYAISLSGGIYRIDPA